MQRPFDLAVDGLKHVHTRVVLGLGGDQVPAGVLGVGGLAYGSALLVWETRVTLLSVTKETDFPLSHHQRRTHHSGTN